MFTPFILLATAIIALGALAAWLNSPGAETDREHIETTVRRHGSGNGMVATASKLYFRGLAINTGLKLIGVALMIAVAWFAYQRISDITTDYAESQLTGNPAVTQPAPETTPPAPAPATSPAPGPTSPTTAETTPEPEPAPAPTDIRNRMPKDVRCAYSIDTDRCACLDPRGFKFPAELAQCKARALGEA